MRGPAWRQGGGGGRAREASNGHSSITAFHYKRVWPGPAGREQHSVAMSAQRLELLLDRNSKLSAQCDVQRKQINELEKR